MTKLVFITGAGSGIGQLAARNYAAKGWQVAALDVNGKGLEQTQRGYEQRISTWLVDITDNAAINEAVASIENTIGPIHTVYHCAAIMPYGKLLEQDASVIHKLMHINYGGLVNVATATLPAMIARKEGCFVSFASLAGLIPVLMTGAYSATKAAVAMFTEVLYHENRNSGVQFACVCPPIVNTPLLKQGHDTVWPKMLENQGEPITPQEVLDTIDACLQKGEFWVYPGKRSKIGALVRRLFPGLVWKQVHQTEGW